MDANLKQDALNLASTQGFAIFTLCPKEKIPYKGSRGHKDASVDAAVIEQMFREHPNSNIGVACGAVSGNLGVIDFDLDEEKGFDGREELADWQASHGKLPETACVVTGRGGMHLYYRFPEGTPKSYSNGTAHVDFRGEGGYALLPGSIHPNGRTVFWDLDPEDTPIADADENVLAFVKSYGPDNLGSNGMKKPFELPEVAGKGSRDDTLYRYACSERSKCVPYDVALVALRAYNKNYCEPPLSDSVVVQKVKSAYSYPPGTSYVKDAGVSAEEDFENEQLILGNPHVEPRRNKNGDIISIGAPTVPAILWWFQKDPVLDGVRLEKMSQNITTDRGVPWDDSVKVWRTVDDDYLFDHVQQTYKWNGAAIVRSDKNMAKAFSIYVHSYSYDALIDMLEALPEWDGAKRKDTILVDFLGAEDTSYTRAVTALMLRAALARAYQPGCKYDHMVVLQGGQGIGKSTMFRRLAMRDEFFVDDVKHIGMKEAQEQIQGAWFVEFSELSGFRNTQIEQLKQFITSQTDTFRVPYDKRATQMPRRCVLTGTTNASEYLDDPTGNRRFLPVSCKGSGGKDLFSQDIDSYFEQVWAEALVEYRAEPHKALLLPPEVRAEADAKRAEATVEDSWIGTIGEWLEKQPVGSFVCTKQILEHALFLDSYQIKKSECMRCSSIVTQYFPQWEKTKSNRTIEGYGSQRAFRRVADGTTTDVAYEELLATIGPCGELEEPAVGEQRCLEGV